MNYDLREALRKNTELIDENKVKYRLGDVIGRGGTGIVYEAQKEGNSDVRSFAVKELLPNDCTRRETAEYEFLQKMREIRNREIVIPQKLGQRNFLMISPIGYIDQYVDLRGRRHGTAMILYEDFRLQGNLLCDLQNHTTTGKLKVLDALLITWKILIALGNLHDLQYLHGDLQPANILLCGSKKESIDADNLVAVLLDFGCIRKMKKLEDGWKTDPIKETYAMDGYSPPENRIGHSLTKASDLFQVGMLLNRMLTGKNYLTEAENGTESSDYFFRYQKDSLEHSLKEIEEYPLKNDVIFQKLLTILSKACQADWKKRYQKAEEFAHDVKELINRYKVEKEIPSQNQQNGYQEVLLKEQKKKEKIFRKLKGIAFAGESVITLAMFLPLLSDWVGNAPEIHPMYSSILLCISVSLLFLPFLIDHYARKIADLTIYCSFMKEDSRIWLKCKDNIGMLLNHSMEELYDDSMIHTTREDRRNTLEILLGILGVTGLIASILFMSFPLFGCWMCICVAGYIAIDYRRNVKLYTENYDALDARETDQPQENKIYRALAKIYETDYNAYTRTFDSVKKDHFFQHSKKAMQYIMISAKNRQKDKKQTRIAYTMVLSLFTYLITAVYSYDSVLLAYFHFPISNFFYGFMTLLILLSFLTNIRLVMLSENYYKIHQYLTYYSHYDAMSREKLQKKADALVEKKILTKLDVARGIFKYDCFCFSKKQLITEIDKKDRMTYEHRIIANVPRLFTYVSMGTIALLFWFVWQMELAGGIVILPLGILLYLVLKKYWLKKVNLKKIEKALKKL